MRPFDSITPCSSFEAARPGTCLGFVVTAMVAMVVVGEGLGGYGRDGEYGDSG